MTSIAALARDFMEFAEDAAIGFGLDDFGLVTQNRWGNMKVGPAPNHREHFEVQLFRGQRGMAVEVGFHAEHRAAADNDAAIAVLAARERQWRKALGRDPVIGPFAKGAKHWRRVSEVWDGVEFDGGVAVDAGARLVEYLGALVPVLRADGRWPPA